jgi:hypothetical protein
MEQTEMYRAHAIVIIAVLAHGDAPQAQRAAARVRAQPIDPSLQAQLDAALLHRGAHRAAGVNPPE